MSVKLLDLDSIKSPVDFTIKLNGVDHQVVETTLEDFIANSELVEAQGMHSDPAKELKLMVKIIKRSVPTIPEDELFKLRFSQVAAIKEFVMTANGEMAEKSDQPQEGADGAEGKSSTNS